jgi:hypothetical protein
VRYLRQPGSHGLPTYALWASIFLVMGILTWSSLTIHAIATPSTIQRRVQPESFITSPLWTLGGSANGLPLGPEALARNRDQPVSSDQLQAVSQFEFAIGKRPGDSRMRAPTEHNEPMTWRNSFATGPRPAGAIRRRGAPASARHNRCGDPSRWHAHDRMACRPASPARASTQSGSTVRGARMRRFVATACSAASSSGGHWRRGPAQSKVR